MALNKWRFALPLAALLAVPTLARAQSTTTEDPTADSPDAKAVAWCVGGPRQPSYAYRDYGRAQRCFESVASQGNDCRRFARLGRCEVYRSWDIGRFRPYDCRCNPQIGAVGYWF
jgi:hypothetical protein